MDKVLAHLQALCSRREYCRKDIYEKALARLDGDAQAATQMVESLVKDRFVDDLRYATAFARDKSVLSGWGPVKIRMALKAKKVDDSVISQALSSTDADAAGEKLEKLLRAKARTLDGDPQARLKLIRFALSRGYEYDEIFSYLCKL